MDFQFFQTTNECVEALENKAVHKWHALQKVQMYRLDISQLDLVAFQDQSIGYFWKFPQAKHRNPYIFMVSSCIDSAN